MRRVITVGDSHAFANWPMAVHASDIGGFELETLVHDGCSLNAEQTARPPSCKAYWDWVAEGSTKNLRSGDVLFVTFLWYQYSGFTYEAVQHEIAQIASNASGSHVSVIVQAPLPVFDRSAYACIREWFRTDYRGCDVSVPEARRQRAGIDRALQALKQEHSNLYVWDPAKYLCDSTRCSQFVGSKPLFRDGGHLSYYGASSLAPQFSALVGTIR